MSQTKEITKKFNIKDVIGIKTQRLGSLLILDLICWDSDDDEIKEIRLQLEGDFGPVNRITIRH